MFEYFSFFEKSIVTSKILFQMFWWYVWIFYTLNNTSEKTICLKVSYWLHSIKLKLMYFPLGDISIHRKKVSTAIYTKSTQWYYGLIHYFLFFNSAIWLFHKHRVIGHFWMIWLSYWHSLGLVSTFEFFLVPFSAIF